MPLLIARGADQFRVPVDVTERETVLRIELDLEDPPERVLLDPDGWVLEGGRGDRDGFGM